MSQSLPVPPLPSCHTVCLSHHCLPVPPLSACYTVYLTVPLLSSCPTVFLTHHCLPVPLSACPTHQCIKLTQRHSHYSMAGNMGHYCNKTQVFDVRPRGVQYLHCVMHEW